MSSEIPSFESFTASELPGGIVVNVFSVLSAVGLLSIVFRVVWLAVSALFKSKQDWVAPREYTFFHSHIGYYAGCLLLADLCSAMAGLLGLTWIIQGGITPGPVCTSQAVLLQFANACSAYFVVVLSVHTFLTLVLRLKAHKALAWSIIALGVVFGLGLSLYPMFLKEKLGPVYGPAGLICGVRSVFPQYQFSLHLLPIFIASSLSALISSLVYLILRGTLVVSGSLKINLDPKVRWEDRVDEGYHEFVTAISRSMLWFPVAYICLLVPYAVVRLLNLSGRPVPFGVTIFAFVCWFLLGIVNVILLLNTFRVLVPAIEAQTQTSRKDLESVFGTPEFSGLPKEKQGYGLTSNQIEQYRNPQKSLSMSSTSSTFTARPLLLTTDSSSYVPRTISPSSVLNRGISSPEPVATRYSGYTRSQNSSSVYSVGLSAAPRPIRSNIARDSGAPERIPSHIERSSISQESDGLMVPRGRGVSIASVNSSTMEDLDVSVWLSRQPSDGSMPHASLSAVATQDTFPTKPRPYFEVYPRNSMMDVPSSFQEVPSQPLVGPVPLGRRRYPST